MNENLAILSRRVERAEVESNELYARAWAEVDPAAGAVTQWIGGALAVYTGVDSPLTQVLGLGMVGLTPMGTHRQDTAPVNAAGAAAALDGIEDFFFSRGAPVNLSICPLVGAGWLALLGERGYRVAGFESVVAMSAEAVDVDSGVTVRMIEAAEADQWAELTATGFLAPAAPTRNALLLAGLPARVEACDCFAGFVGEEMAAAGGLLRAGDAWLLINDATLPAWRRRGLQSALIAARLRRAVEQGGGLVIAGVVPGSVSERNYLRAGFRTLYTKATLSRNAEPSSARQ